MSEKDLKSYLDELKAFKKKVTSNKKSATKLLVDAGIITEKGNLKKPYKGLCIPQDQA